MSHGELVFNGIDGASGRYLQRPLTPAQIVAIARGEPLDPEQRAALKLRHEQTLDGAGVVENVEDPADLAEAGWGAIFAADADPAVREALAPLLDHRRAQASARDQRFYREYAGKDGYQAGESKMHFLARHGAGPGPADPRSVPYYLLIVGDPETIPYHFQYQLDVQYAVGRLHFDNLDEYAHYACAVVRAETGAAGRAVTQRGPTRPDAAPRAAFFGVRNADDRATELSADYLVAPLAQRLASAFPAWDVEAVLAGKADKARLGQLLGGEETPSLLFTASHCLGFPHGDVRQRDHQGAILCQDWPGPREWRDPIPPEHYFSADDVAGEEGLEGLVAFIFGCYGAGTPHLDSFAHRVAGERRALAPQAFVARLPQRLLAHPRGSALAVVGHVDRTWSYSYAWYEAGTQLGVFESALQRLMKGYPVGYAMEFFDERYAELSTMIGAELEEIKYGYEPDDWELAGLWTANNDARGYVIVGDPAVRLGVGEGKEEELADRLEVTLQDLGDYCESHGASYVAELSRRIQQLVPEIRLPAEELADKLELALQDLGDYRESDGVSYVAELSRRIQQLALPPPGTPRWVQGQVYELHVEGEPQRVERALRAGARHMLVVRIGAADREWLTPPEEAVFPEHLLPPDEERHELRVVFCEPNHVPQPQTATLILSREGASTTCQFLFQTRSDVPTFQGRVIVLHRNRVLQTALLEGQVVADPAQDPVAAPLRLGIEGVIRPVLTGLEARQEFALALVTNHTAENSPAVTAISGEWATFRPLGDLDDKRRQIVSLLGRLADMPDEYPKDLRNRNNVDLLWSLAFLGNALYRGVVPSQISPDRLKDVPRIQLVSASHEYLPLEFFYDLPAPKMGAELCPNAEVALEAGKCAKCAGPKEVPGVGADTICPLGFWCMRMVIERQAVRAARGPELQGAPFALRPAPVPGADELKVLRGAILAASEKVDAMRPGTTQEVLDKLQDATARHVVEVRTWDAWLQAVKDGAPSLLVLLPHTSKVHLPGLDWPQLEIGHGQTLVEAYITPEHLLPSPDAGAPVVFLLGCETLAPDVGVGDFTVAFQDRGAAIVLSTLTPVLGRDVGPVAEALIDHLAKTVQKRASAANNTFGYAMRTLRRQALAQGNLMVLCLVAHGDADWRLAPT